MTDVVTLAKCLRGDKFRFGKKTRLRMCQDGSLRHENWRDRWTEALTSFFWPRGSFVVTHIDQGRGTITVESMP